MWTKLTEISELELEAIAKELLAEPTPLLADVVRLAMRERYADRLAVAAGFGHLSLTTCLSWRDQHHHWFHPDIGLKQTAQDRIVLRYSSGGEYKKLEAGFAREVQTPTEAVSQIERFMIRMPYDTEVVEEEIRRAIERKRAWESSQS